MRKIYETLEFDQVKNQLMNFVSSTLGRHKVDELEMYQDCLLYTSPSPRDCS